ncbi:hypothetical protein Tco_1302701 [Tanacetum coccineum]
MLAEAQEVRQILDEEQLAFLANLSIPAGQAQTIIPHNAAFQTEDLDTYDSDYDDLLNAQAVLMANISTYGSDVISEVPNPKTYLNDMDNQSVHALQDFEQSPVMDFTDNGISSDSNIIPYSQYFCREKMIDSQMDDMIKEKLALKEQKAQRIKPTLYDGVVISNTYVAMPVIDDEETLILEDESRSKMSEKAKDLEVIAKKISHKPIDYEKLNRLSEDFKTRFTPQQELLAKQAFWFHILNPTIEPFYSPPILVDVPSELPKKRTTPSALEEGEWGFEHTKIVFNNEILPFLKSLKDIFNVFDKDLLNEIMKVQTIFDQMEAAVQQSSVDKQCVEIAKKELLLENDRLLHKIMSQDVMITVMNSMFVTNESANMEMQIYESCDKCLHLDAEFSKSKQAYNALLKSHSQLEKHCISLEVSNKLNQEIFQKDESCINQNALEIPEYFEKNDLKAQLQDKDTTICKLKDIIKSMRENSKDDNVNNDLCELETKNKELENRKEIVENVVHIPSANTFALGIFKLDLELLPPRLLQNREVHIDYLRNTQEQANILWEIVEQAKAKQPLDGELDLACKYTTRIQELLVYVQDTCPNTITPNTRKVVVTPMNNVKKVRFAEPLTSSSNSKQVESSNTSDSNTGVKCSTRNCRSKPPGNKNNDRIS